MKIGYYIEEIGLQIKSANKALEAGGEVFDREHHFLIHCAIIHKILWPSINKKKVTEGNEIELFKKERGESIRSYFDDSSYLTNIQIKKFRNHFEHIDERIDDAVKKGFIVDKNISFNPGEKMGNVIQGFEKQSQLRSYENGLFCMQGECFDIQAGVKWLNKLASCIEQKGIPEIGTNTMTNCSFLF